MSVATPTNAITIALSVTDRHASAAWYEKMLGFKVLYHADDVGWSEMSTNTDGVTLGFGEQAEVKHGNTMPVFGIDDVHTARKNLEEAGVKFDGDTMVIDNMVALATFYDPDDNALMLAQDLSPDAQ